MTTLAEGAFAKINLTLDVLDRREDGYHDIRSILQTVALRDDIELLLDTGTGWRIECETAGIPLDETNLAWRAARVFFDTFGGEPDGLTIRITKRIPSGAGLGGGSADAAAVLRALNRWKDYPLSVYALCELGAQIGSDVPFCVLCGTALAEGRGERLTKLPDTPEMFTVICKPDVCFSTPAVLLFSPIILKLGMERGLDETAALWSVVLGSVGSAAGRLLMPMLSDKIGRRPTDLILFGASLGLSAAFVFAQGWAVVAVYASLTFCYSALAAVLPALSTDLFGLPHAGVNYGFLALGQSVGSLAFPFAANLWGLETGRHWLAMGGAAAGFAAIWALRPVQPPRPAKEN